MWEFRSTAGGAAVRLRGVDERLGHALERCKNADEAAEQILGAEDDLNRLQWRYASVALQALAQAGSEEVSMVVRRVDAQRRILGVLSSALSTTSLDDASVS